MIPRGRQRRGGPRRWEVRLGDSDGVSVWFWVEGFDGVTQSVLAWLRGQDQSANVAGAMSHIIKGPDRRGRLPPVSPAPFGRSRLRVEGDSRSGANKVRPRLGNVAVRVPRASPRARRRFGPLRATGLDLVSSADVSDAHSALTRNYTGGADRSAQGHL